jgi:hypothetical protein
MKTARNRSMSLLCACAASLFAVALVPSDAQAVTVNVSGTVDWTDLQSNLHPTRLDAVQIIGQTPLGGTFVAGTGTCDLYGNYSISFTSLAPGLNTYQLQVLPSNVSTYVSSDGTAANTYVISTPTFGLATGNNTVNFNVPNNNDAPTQSLAVADALVTTYQYATDARGAAPGQLPTWFYSETAPSAGGTYVRGGTAYISKTDAYDFDVNEHEIGHYLESLDGLSNNGVGGPHVPGVTCIGYTQTFPDGSTRTLDKLEGTQLAWSEGLATFIAVASQHDNPAGYNLPTKLQNVGDNYFDDFGELDGKGNINNTSTDLAGFDVGTQQNNGTITYVNVPGQGEGDEIVVQRILYAITNITGNFAPQRSPVQVYKDVIAAAKANGGTLQNLSQFNNYCMNTICTTDKQRVGYGAIYQYFGVSPAPTGAMAGDPTLSNTDPAPTFTWSAGNNGANETFQLTIWDSLDLTNRIIDTFAIPLADGTSYTLTAAQWAIVDATAGTKEFVIIGSDNLDSTGVAYAANYQTGGYWSNAYPFEVTVPEPSIGILLMGCLTGVVARRHRPRQPTA